MTTIAQAPGRPVVEGLFEETGGAARLLGTRCKSCATLYFPRSLSCRNPDCAQKAVEAVLLPAAGILHSFTIQRYAPPPIFRMDDWQPYAIGLVDLGEGLLVMGMLTDMPLDTIAIGMRVQAVVAPLFHDEGGAVHTYKFAPADPAGAC